MGAIITDERGKNLGTGYNGTPRGFPHCIERKCEGADDAKGDSSRCLAVHAEINAILQCADLDKAHTMYTSASPCFNCAKAIANTGIKRVVAAEKYTDVLGLDVLKRAGIILDIVAGNGGFITYHDARFVRG